MNIKTKLSGKTLPSGGLINANSLLVYYQLTKLVTSEQHKLSSSPVIIIIIVVVVVIVVVIIIIITVLHFESRYVIVEHIFRYSTSLFSTAVTARC